MILAVGAIPCPRLSASLYVITISSPAPSSLSTADWYVTNVSWWTSPRVAALLEAIDDTQLLMSERMGDHAIQTSVVQTLMPRARRRQFLDWTYEHISLRGGEPTSMGGVSTHLLEPPTKPLSPCLPCS